MDSLKYNEETFNRDVFLKNVKVGAIALFIGSIIGGTVNSDSTEIGKLNTQVSNLEMDKDEFVKLSIDRSDKIKAQEHEISELKAKVESASPWFEMEEEQREQQRQRIAQEKAQKEAEAEAKRLKEEAEAKAQQEEANKKIAEANGDPLVEKGLEILRNNMGDIAKISYKKDTSTFLINPNTDGFKRELEQVVQGNLLNEWDILVDGMVRLSYSMRNELPGKTVALVNPFNDGNFLLLLKDGIIVYDFTQE